MNQEVLQSILKRVQKPGQYLGNEVNAVHKPFAETPVRVCLVFPDAYEMGMSHVGLKILYEICNREDGVVAERCFAPLKDMEAQLRKHRLPLFSLESKTALSEFDVIGITLPYELTYTNVLNILNLAAIPLWQKDRSDHHPLILGGGTQSYNPEPVADFFDAIAIGDGEELILDILATVSEWKSKNRINRISQNKTHGSRGELLTRLTHIEGVYIPSFFAPKYHENGTLKEVTPLKKDYTGVKKRIVSDLNTQPYPLKPIVPNVKLIHDRIGIEIQRGCTRMCRFCQAGYIERPTRQRAPEKVIEIAREAHASTGIEEISLLSLSAGDYQTIVPTLKQLNHQFKNQRVSISVPATRTETLTREMINEVKKVRMTGFTIAPEAGSARMRRVINKGNDVTDLLQACENAFSQGYRLIKFYYMCGLPFETDKDVINIANEAYQALEVGWRYTRNVKINVSVSSFVPKPFTPFQWEPQMTIAETRRRYDLVKRNLKHRALVLKHHDPEMSCLEGLFARGDRRLGRLLYQAFQNGCRFDQWSEHFDFKKWKKAFAQTGTDLDFYLHRRRSKDEVLPWDHLFIQMKKSWLWREYENAAKEAFVPDCSVARCADFCGACDFKQVKNRIYVVDEKPVAVKKANREAYGRFAGPPHARTVRLSDNPTPSDRSQSHKVNQPKSSPLARLRVHFSKTGPAAFIGHLELMNMLRRAIGRNEFPVAYSEGYHPQMKISMGMPLSLGVESECESFDLVLRKKIEPADFINKMNASLPGGLRVLQAEYIDLAEASLYSKTRFIDYRIDFTQGVKKKSILEFFSNLNKLATGVPFYLTKGQHKGHKTSKTVRINDYVHFGPNRGGKEGFYLRILCDNGGTLKPTDVIAALSSITQNELADLRVRKVGISLSP